MFEQKLKHSNQLPPKDRVKLLVENGLYEEQQANVPRARKIFEQLETEVAPGLLQAIMARIDFEKRQGNKEVVSQLFAQTLQRAIETKNNLQVTFVGCKFAQYLVTEAKD